MAQARLVWAALLALLVVALSAADVGAAPKSGARAPVRATAPTVAPPPASSAVGSDADERRAPAQFEWTSRPQSLDMDARADAKRDEAIAKLKKIMPSVADGPQKAELIFRLSEMYWAKSKFQSLRAMRAWDQALEAWSKRGGKGEQPKLEATAESDEAEVYKREALSLYDRILKSYPDYPRRDEVLYNLGSTLYEAGDKQRGVEVFNQLLLQFPASDFSADVWLALGEHFFNTNRLAQAIKAYSEAARVDASGAPLKPRIYSFALYKLAWCDFNLQQYENALAKFRAVIAYARRQESASAAGGMAERDRIQLANEALVDIVRTYSHLDAIDDAFDYYVAEVGAADAYGYLRRLAMLYNSDGKVSLEIKTYEELNRRYPDAPDAPQNQTAILNGYAQLGRTTEVRGEVRRLIDLYSPDGEWARRNAGNQKVLDSAFGVVEGELAALVTEQHRAAQQTKLPETYRLARDIYREYLEKFATSRNAYRFRFYYAKILFELKEFEAAAEAYGRVVDADPKGEFLRAAAFSVALAWDKVASGVKEQVGARIEEPKTGKAKGGLRTAARPEELEKGKRYLPSPLSAVEEKLSLACDRFVQLAPDDPEAVKISFKSALVYFNHNQFDAAAARLGDIILRWPKDNLGRVAAELILQSYAVRDSWTELNSWGRRLARNAPLMADKAFAKRLGETIELATFNEVHFLVEPKGSPRDTAAGYVAFVKEFPRSKYALVALYNAVVAYESANDLDNAMAYADRALRDYSAPSAAAAPDETDGAMPRPEVVRERLVFMAASLHERIAEYAEAAALYERYARDFAAGPRRADALFNAGLYREGLGEYDKAIADFTTYGKDFPDKDDVPQIAWRVGALLEKKQDHVGAERHFTAYARTFGSDAAMALCAVYEAEKALWAQGKDKEARERLDDITRGYSRLSAAGKGRACALEAAAGAAFRAIDPDFNAYVALTLAVNERELGPRLARKLQLLKDLQTRYTQVLALGQATFGLASLYRIGVIYQDLAQGIFHQQCPRRLNEEQCSLYEATLQEQAFPLEEKAVDAFEKALAKGYELGIYGDWLHKTQEALKKYEPTRFPDAHDLGLGFANVAAAWPNMREVAP